MACPFSFAFSTILYSFSLKTRHICIIDDDFNPFQCFVSCNTGFLLIAEWQAPTKKKAGEREDIDYGLGTSGSEAATPKKGRKKKETPDPGLTLGTDIGDQLKPDGRQVEVELDNVRIDQKKKKGQIRSKDTKLLQNCIESLEAAPPTGPLHVVLWEDTSMLPTDCSLFSLREPLRMDVSDICRWRLLVCIWTAQRGSDCKDSGKATRSLSGSAAVAYYMHRRYSEAYDTVGLPCKAGGTSTRKRTRR